MKSKQKFVKRHSRSRATITLPKRFAHKPFLALAISMIVVAGGASVVIWSRSRAAGVTVEAVVSASAYNARKDRYIDALFTSTSTSWAGLDTTRGIALIDQAMRTGNTSRLNEANDLIYSDIGNINPSDSGGSLAHGGPLTYATAYLRYKDRPDLLYPSTRERIKTGKLKNGSVDSSKSLIAYKEQIFNRFTADSINFDIATYNPWNPSGSGGYNGTENHKLQTITAAMLLTEIYAGESYRGYPVKDSTPARDDFWHYFRDAFFRYSQPWNSNGRPNDHFGKDISGLEKDASQYTRAYVEDYWLIRDFYSDPIVSKHAEIMLDRVLIDMAEDTVMGMYTGSAGRYYNALPSEGINQQVHVINYLLFDSLGYQLPLSHAYRWGFATWGYGAILSSDYGPTHPDFPKAIIDLAINKENGYLVRNGEQATANWVEKDLALGFRVNGAVFGEGHSGGFYVYDTLARGSGLNIAPFYGATPFQKAKPQQNFSGVVDRRAAIVRDFNSANQLKLWIQDGFDTAEMTSTWMFFKQSSSSGREVYLAVRPSVGSHSAAASITDPNQRGAVRTFSNNEAPLIWEVSTSEEHASFTAFKSDVTDNQLTVTSDRVVYVSSKLGTSLLYNRSNHQSHQVNSVTVNWADYAHGFQTPWSSNAHGSYKAAVNKNGYSVTYNWSPNSSGSFDTMPIKIVNNNGNPTPPPPPLNYDLVVTSVASSPASPAPGDPVTFSATIKNEGADATPAGTIHGVAFSVDGAKQTWSDSSTASLAPGAFRTVTANGGTSSTPGDGSWIPTAAGTYSVEAWVDDVNRISESNETNNRRTTPITIATTSTATPGDVNNDGVVNGLDLSRVLTNYSVTNATKDMGDANDDGTVNGLDLSMVLTNYGT